ncbi:MULTISPECIES: ABC transporter permease [Neorhizobium]|jgi:peptide/nickel transport system permease protein|uniref:ABC di/oligopeptide transporter n=2 Tax=Neorhizobium galegae TaxID=399 RepID=A0A068SYQ0_NEOGA|nr:MULTISPECIES: ABC transporter permease [Neorhizobium]KAB1121557.1 ABC transporter permease [Neorhizobium galegae]MCJ9673270.1 ABC transporter permease [Neorhizobium sp. SHOUNA12B]MCJ9745051.1 ABC transporter permease [Neorhizobium sp. SHOUNA12A]MCJ9749993.1 ABC transporter permease [Neorhizobium sp. BETTINA12A]MCQ1570425.1 ABC transporter permease [Neorhizobium galegae]
MSFTYFLKRAAFAALALAALMTSAFFLVRLTGDPVNLYLPVDASDAAREAMRIRLGLDRSLLAQFFDWAWDILSLDFGMSLWHNRPAMDVVLEALPNTLALGAIALALAFTAAIVMGSIAAVNAGGWIDRGVNVLSQAAASVPDFWLGLMGVLLFAVTFRILPTSGFGGPIYWVLPVACLFARPFGTLVQIVRGSMIEALNATFVRTARAKGARDGRVTFVHALRNALLPAVTVTGDLAAQFAGGGGVVEVVFGFPGIGKLLIDGILKRDFAIVQASIFAVAVVIFVINILVDMLYASIDPRVRVE